MRIVAKFLTTTAFSYCKVCSQGIVILSFISTLMAGCAPSKMPQYKADAFNTYKNQVVKSNLYIAILPMTDKEQQDKYFGAALTDVGILPVFIIAENRSASQRFMLRDDFISLQHKTTKQTFPKASQTDASDDSNLEGARRTSQIVSNVTLIISPIITLGAIATSLALYQSSMSTRAIQDNLFDKTLYTQTVLPGKTIEGFAFFKLSDTKIDLADNKTNLKDLMLRVHVTDQGTESTNSFEFSLEK
jgi:hypothetical protein